MVNKQRVTAMTLTVQSGGMLEFEKTGIYPEYLLFHSTQLRRTWRFKQTNEIQNGVLKVNGQIAFHYFFDGNDCKMQTITDGVVTADWEIEMIITQMLD